MSDRAFAYLVYLLRLGLGIPGAPCEPISPEVWRAVYHLATKHAVLGVAWDGVECLQSLSPAALQSMPADLMGKWFADVQVIESANQRLCRQAEELQALFAQDGFRSQVLKGASFAAYYPQPAHRQAADIDLWVQPHQQNEGSQSLSLHRSQVLDFLRSHGVETGDVVYHHIEAKIYPDTEVELHVTPTWLCNSVYNSRLQTLFTQADSLTPELQELYALLHAFRHIYHDGLALRHIMDYYLVRNANRQHDVSAQNAVRQVGLSLFATAMDEVADYLFAEQPKDIRLLSPRARHILAALPSRRISARVKWDYPSETLWVLPWRTWHYFWRKTISK